MDDLISEFLDETSELMDTVSEDIMSLEKAWDIEVINRVYRAFHSIKGNGGMLGFDRVSAFAHRAEDVLSMVRNREVEVTRPVADAILQALDAIMLILADIRNGGDDSRDTAASLQALERIVVASKQQTVGATRSAWDETSQAASSAGGSQSGGDKLHAPPETETPEAVSTGSSGMVFDMSTPDLPEEERTPEATAMPAAMARKNPGHGWKSSRDRELSILIVEDEFTSRQILNAFLSQYGECHLAKDGLEAINAFSQRHESNPLQPYDLICIDINMPQMDGLRATKLMREIERGKGIEGTEYESAIIIISGVDDPATIIKACYDCGANYFFTKPLDLGQITRQLKKLALIK